MTDAAPRRATRDALARTLTVGGILLIAGAVLSFAAPALLSTPGSLLVPVLWAGTIATSAAFVVYAVGLGRGGSVVARRPLGVGALMLLAAWPFVDRLIGAAVPYAEATAEFHLAWGWVGVVARLGAAIVAAVQIARAGVIGGRLRWAPLWALVAVAAPQVLAQVAFVALGPDAVGTTQDGLFLLLGVGQLLAFAAPVTLGILSIITAQRRPVTEPVQVFPPG
jgi:hypothetical protein